MGQREASELLLSIKKNATSGPQNDFSQPSNLFDMTTLPDQATSILKHVDSVQKIDHESLHFETQAAPSTDSRRTKRASPLRMNLKKV